MKLVMAAGLVAVIGAASLSAPARSSPVALDFERHAPSESLPPQPLDARIATIQYDSLHTIVREDYEIALTTRMLPRINEYRRVHNAEITEDVLFYLSLDQRNCDPLFSVQETDTDCYCLEAWSIERNERAEPVRIQERVNSRLSAGGASWRPRSIPAKLEMRVRDSTYTFPGATAVCYGEECVPLPER